MRKRNNQITLRLAGTLRAALEDEAEADGDRGLSATIRKILVEHSAKRITERAGENTGATL
jgi:hypothetical protein